ncbi:MAG: hypothetical protein ACOCRO_04620 [Halanaerobiales bacterium]
MSNNEKRIMDEQIEELSNQIISALKEIRVNVVKEEYILQEMIAKEFENANISYKKEYKLGPRKRIDFFLEPGIGIEVKKGKPNKRTTIKQLKRYTEVEKIKMLILVVERNLSIPEKINGVKCLSFGVNRNWGIAL